MSARRNIAEILISTFDDRPGRLPSTRLAKRAAAHAHQVIKKLVVLPILLGNAPARELVRFELLEVSLLLSATHMHPKLDHQSTVGTQRSFKVIRSLQLSIKFLLARRPVAVPQDGLGIPRTQKDPDAPPRRHPHPKPPKFRAFPLFFGRRRVRLGREIASIQPLTQQIEDVPLAAPVDPVDQDDYREISREQGRLGLQELCPKLLGSRLVVFTA